MSMPSKDPFRTEVVMVVGYEPGQPARGWFNPFVRDPKPRLLGWDKTDAIGGFMSEALMTAMGREADIPRGTEVGNGDLH